ncbi:MAG: hypothetical protein WDZ49_05735 [Litorilinea sp.]
MFSSRLRDKLLGTEGFVSLYGTTPPRANASPARIAAATDKLAARLAQLPIDGVVVYDVQDEAGRTVEPRPFPFLPTLDSRAYAQQLQQQTGHATIVYKCVAEMPEAPWRSWLDDSQHTYGVENLSLVGKPASHVDDHGLTLSQATRMAAAHPAQFALGGVVIAERHLNGVSEAKRIVRKTQNGCRYFISQAVYHAATSARLLADYAQVCAQENLPPARLVLTFVPVGREKTMEFMRWLGIKITPETTRAILGSSTPVSKSIEICCDNLRRILDQPCAESLALGINVESISIHKDEIDASVDLFHALQEVMHGEYKAMH